PLTPTFLDSDDPGQVNDVFGKQNRIFATETQGTDQLFAFDTTNPSNLTQLGNISFDAVYGVFVNGNYAYVAGDRTGAGNDRGLYIVDISNPASMQHLGHVNLTNAEDAFVQGATAFVARLTDGVSAVDVSNPNSPAMLSTANPGGSSKGIFASGNYAYVAAGSLGLAVLNVSDPNSITVAGTHTPSYTPDFINVFVQGAEAFISDGTSNNSSLYIANTGNPQSPNFARRYKTPYTYTDIQVKENYAFLPIDLGLVSVDIFDGPKLSNLQKAATAFVDYEGFSLPPDKMGLVTYANNGSLDVPLGSDKNAMKTGINNIVASGQTDVAPGINKAKNELTSSNADANALKFIVLLGDGKENPGGGSGGQPALNAAQQSADANIIIYTIGFGKDADVNLLTQIAEIGNGKYYQADDKNALQEVFQIIAQEINKKVADVNVSVPSIGGALVLNQGTGAIVDGNLSFQVGVLRSGETWSTTYTLNFPCSEIQNCGVNAISLPGEGTGLTYTDENGNSYTIDFTAQTTLDFKKRDLEVTITSGTVLSPEEVYLDVLVKNSAELDANSIDLNFFLTDLNGELLTTKTVPALCSLDTPGCTSSSAAFNSVFIQNNGKIYATIGDGTEIRECPAGNTDAAFCGEGSPADFIGIKYYIWRK
ncbi:MAG: VWA domain-containing protein, partial [archaeon]